MRNPCCNVGVSLRRLFPESVFLYAADARAQSCTSDPFQVRPGDVYVALDAAESDGHDFVSQAIERGAESVVVERPVPQTQVPMCLVPDTRVAFARLCQALAGDPSHAVSCVGVTGTDGKTVTSQLIASVLREAGRTVGVLDDLEREGARAGRSPSAAMSAPEVASALGEMAASHATHAVVEVSSQALSEHLLSGVQLDAACFTNLTRAHLDLHNSAASYRYVKSRLLQHLRSDGACILNRDDPLCAKLASFAPGPVLTYGMSEAASHADVIAEVIERDSAEQSFLLTFEADTIAVRTRLIGDHGVLNCLAAAAVGIAAGVDMASIARGLERVELVPGRLERVVCMGAPRAYVDNSSTPTALAAALTALRASSGGRVCCVSDVPLIADDEELARFGKVMAKLADKVFLSLGQPYDEWTVERCGQLLSGLEGGERVVLHNHRQEAIADAISEAEHDDTLLIVGSGQVDGDRAMVRRALNDWARERRSSAALFLHG